MIHVLIQKKKSVGGASEVIGKDASKSEKVCARGEIEKEKGEKKMCFDHFTE